MMGSPKGLVRGEFARNVIQGTPQHGQLGEISRLEGGGNQLKQLGVCGKGGRVHVQTSYFHGDCQGAP